MDRRSFHFLMFCSILIRGWRMQAGLSMALGAFLAGLLLAETEFALQVESDIAPYRGLLLGLFFMTVRLCSLNCDEHGNVRVDAHVWIESRTRVILKCLHFFVWLLR